MRENMVSQAKKPQIPSSQCRFFQSAHFVRSRDHTGQLADKIFTPKAVCKTAIVPLAHIKPINSPQSIITPLSQCARRSCRAAFQPLDGRNFLPSLGPTGASEGATWQVGTQITSRKQLNTTVFVAIRSHVFLAELAIEVYGLQQLSQQERDTQ